MSYITEYIEDTDEDSSEDCKETSKDDRADDATQTNFARRINRIWLDVHSLIPRTDPGLFIPGIPTEYFAPHPGAGTKRPLPGDDDDDNVSFEKFPRLSSDQATARGSGSKNKDKTTGAIDKRKPDIVLAEHTFHEQRKDYCLWRHFAVLVEVKVSRAEAPNPSNGQEITRLVAQVADVARLHLAARPFMRYSVHLTICGAVFNLVIFDRAGGVVSRDYNIIKDLQMFVRIIYRLGRELDAYDLGLDPTVTPLHDLGSWTVVPEYQVIVGDSMYVTKGVPLWQSTGLVGRGTFVWVVYLDEEPGSHKGNKHRSVPLIMKNAWRASGRLAESTVYKMLFNGAQESLPELPSLDGVAQFVEGGDIFDLENPNNNVIKVSGHRQGFGNPIKELDDPVLHRLVLASRGRKLYEYETFSQLMKGTKKIVGGWLLACLACHHLLTLP
jgi:Fungal protein kinase